MGSHRTVLQDQVRHSQGPEILALEHHTKVQETITMFANGSRSFHRMISAVSPQGQLTTECVLLLLHGDGSVCRVPPSTRGSPHLTACCFTAATGPTLLWPPGRLYGDTMISKSLAVSDSAPCTIYTERFQVQVFSYHFTSCISRNELPSCTVELISDMLGLRWTLLCKGKVNSVEETCSVSDVLPLCGSGVHTAAPELSLRSSSCPHDRSDTTCRPHSVKERINFVFKDQPLTKKNKGTIVIKICIWYVFSIHGCTVLLKLQTSVKKTNIFKRLIWTTYNSPAFICKVLLDKIHI